MNGGETHPTSSWNRALPVFLKSLYLHCGHCDAWAPSPTTYWYFEGYERARSRGILSRCRRCHKVTRSNEQRYRAFFEDGDHREGC